MLIFDFRAIGNKLFSIRKQRGMTQAEVAEAAGLSDRTYADIERGTVNMRIETILRICQVLHITPDEIMTEDKPAAALPLEALIAQINTCTPEQQRTALQLLQVYLDSL